MVQLHIAKGLEASNSLRIQDKSQDLVDYLGRSQGLVTHCRALDVSTLVSNQTSLDTLIVTTEPRN